MGHRHMFNTSQIIKSDNDEGWNSLRETFARAGAPEVNDVVYPAENTVIDGGNIASQWSPPPTSGGYPSRDLTGDYTQYQPQARHPFHDPLLHTSASGVFQMAQENFACPLPSSVHGGHTFHGIGDSSLDFRVSARGPYKRKRPDVHPDCQQGSTSGCYDAGSSSLPMPVDSWHDKPVADTLQSPWEFSSNNRGHGITIRSEDTSRNVRSRAAFNLDGNLAGTHSATNPSNNCITSLPADRPSAMNVWGQTPNTYTRGWNPSLVNHAAYDMAFVSEPREFVHEHRLNEANNNPSAVFENMGHHGHHSLRQDPILRSDQGNFSQSVRGLRSSYAHRSVPSLGASSSNLHLGHVAMSDEGLQVNAHSYSARHSRPYASLVLHDRSGRSRMGGNRFRSLHDEGLMIVERSALYGSRSLNDQHRDMRLDIDNMTYEELLALEERIGAVNTGLSDDLISKCLTESIFCSSDQLQEGEKCVICLDEYKNMDDVGTLKLCGHDFHVECVRKWLAMKNMCPICKASAMEK